MRVVTTLALTVPIIFLAAGCGSGTSSTGTGGSVGSGGSPATGGAPGTGGAATGGSLGSGGAAGHATGGAVGTGGGAGHATGGSSATGGTAGQGSGGTAGHATGGASSTGGTAGHATGGATATGGTAGHATGGASATGGTAGHATGGSTGTGGTVVTDAGATSTDGGTIGPTGNPNGSCSGGLPSRGQPADVSSPTSVVGTGTPGSCTFAALKAAVAKAGVITFNCGAGAVTIAVTQTLTLLTTKNTVIDGGNKVTLDGQHAVQIFNYYSANYKALSTTVTLQHLALINGKTTPTQMIPPQPSMPACSQGWDDGQGGALFMRDGDLNVIDCLFTGNQAAPLGPDVGGGAIYMEGSKDGATIVGSTFINNSGANAGAVGSLQGELDIYNCLFQTNTATGHDANSNDTSMTMCTAMNAGQYEIGSGGNGGAIYGDGNSFNITLCGDAVLNNAAGTKAFGGGLFFTSDDFMGTLTIIDTTMTGNTGGSWTSVKSGSVTNAGSAIGVNAKSITITNSTLQ